MLRLIERLHRRWVRAPYERECAKHEEFGRSLQRINEELARRFAEGRTRR
jgi:hypothetical protein